jgi:hypothetical protein
MTEDRIKTALKVSLLLSGTLFFFGPSHIYLYNVLEFPYTFLNLSLMLGLFTGIVFAIVCAFVLVVDARMLERRLVPVLFALSALLFLQGNLIVWDYGILDGSDIYWGEKHLYGVVDSAVWIAFLCLALFKHEFFYRVSRLGSVALIVLQSVSLLFLLVKAPGDAWIKYASNEEARFKFSSGKNIAIMILDQFQTDIFAEIIHNDKRYIDIFDGFTYFPDAVAGFPTTYPSIPLILTGKYYKNSIPMQEFIKKAYFSGSSIPKTLKGHGYNVLLSTAYPRTVYLGSAVVSEAARRGILAIPSFKEAAELLDITLFRYLPHYMKMLVFDDRLNQPYLFGKFLNRTAIIDVDMLFIEEMMSMSEVAIKENVFRFYHMKGVHIPYILNESLEYEALNYDRQGLKTVARAKLKITQIFLNTLEKMGIYDNTMLFIIADHGSGTPNYYLPSALGDVNDMSCLAPLVLVKPFRSRGPLRVSKSPVALSDIPKTVFDALGIKGDAPGTSMFKLDPLSKRERLHLTYTWGLVKDWDRNFFVPMKEYKINGMSWLRRSWQNTGRIFASHDVKMEEDRYVYGTYINFGTSGNSGSYQSGGWEDVSESSSTVKGQASLDIPVSPPMGPVVLAVELEPDVLTDKTESRSVVVKVEGKTEARWTVDSTDIYSAIIPAIDVKDKSTLNIVFEFPDALSERDSGAADPQRSGVKFKWLVLYCR